jgi:hypothetical protein
MQESGLMEGLKEIFAFPFRSPKWENRFVLGSGLILVGFIIPIVPLLFLYGYVVEVMRLALEGKDLALPAWDDWGKYLKDGLRLVGVGLAFLAPALLVMLIGLAPYFSSTLILTLSENAESLPAYLPGVYLASLGLLFLTMSLGGILMLGGAAFLPVATAHFIKHDSLAAAFRVREWWPRLRGNLLGYLIAWVIAFGLAMVAYWLAMLPYLTMVLCCLTPIVGAPISFYVALVYAGLFGRIYRESELRVSGK